MDEHRIIETALDALGGYGERLEAGDPAAEPADLGRFVDFIRHYADAHHHGKEEAILFAAMIAGGFPAEAGPIAVMLREHEQGRHLVGVLAEAAANAGRWGADDIARIRDSARDYIALLHQHIAKEDQILYPMAASELSDATLAEIDRKVVSFERDPQHAGEAERLRALAAELATRYGSGIAADGREG